MKYSPVDTGWQWKFNHAKEMKSHAHKFNEPIKNIYMNNCITNIHRNFEQTNKIYNANTQISLIAF